MEYAGTLLLVSHDREFLNNVVTSTLVLSGEGTVGEYVGGYDDWLRQAAAEAPAAPVTAKVAEGRLRPKTEKPRKLSFKEERELEALPERILELEGEQGTLHGRLSDPEFYRTAGGEVARLNARLAELEEALEEAYRRWEELEKVKDLQT
jgi:ATP-binding cassette subfamily F protein uup